MRAKEIVQRCATPERFKELCIKAQITHTYYLFHSLIPRTMAKIARTLCENAAQHISIVRNYALGYLEQCTTPLIYCHYEIPLRSIAERGTEVEQK